MSVYHNKDGILTRTLKHILHTQLVTARKASKYE